MLKNEMIRGPRDLDDVLLKIKASAGWGGKGNEQMVQGWSERGLIAHSDSLLLSAEHDPSQYST